jgi:hypothetical protein
MLGGVCATQLTLDSSHIIISWILPIWTWEDDDDDDDDAGELLVQQATYATKLCDFVGGREMSGVSSFVLLDFNNKQKKWVFFLQSKKEGGLKEGPRSNLQQSSHLKSKFYR